MIDNQMYMFAFVLMGQIIEFLGAHYDRKPLKSSSQSQKRFSKGLNILLGNRYRNINTDHWFYAKFRNQLTHTFTVSSEIILCSLNNKPKEARHLRMYDGKLVLVAEDFYQDIEKACLKLIKELQEKPQMEKKIPDCYDNGFL
ncbi:MAG: hypothetical protein N4A49_05790 [Marinifilaceae bacterium]|nr:hypothetical protein [Marinifilaceae bacterium]